jgi:hypothetical protein
MTSHPQVSQEKEMAIHSKRKEKKKKKKGESATLNILSFSQ